MDKGTRSFAPDVLADILTRLPPNTRRRLRLICRHWRHVIDMRTATDLRSRTKTLVVTRGTAYVFDDLSTGLPSRELWTRGTGGRYKDMRVVGTCNGVICLCDNRRRGGAITLVNPAIAEALTIPSLSLPYAGGFHGWHRTYSFTYQQATGRYKIMHIPLYLDRVPVFTLGEASWRDVTMPTGRPAARCDHDAGIVNADGKTYLVVEGTEERIVSFDLDDENLTSVRPLPSILSRPGTWGLSEVHGRLAISFSHVSQTLAKTEVWVMEGVTGHLKWNCWYIWRRISCGTCRSTCSGSTGNISHDHTLLMAASTS